MTQFMNDLVLVIPEFAKARYPSSQEEREKLAHIIVNEKALRFCEVAETRLKKNGGTYLVGKSVILSIIV
jgi:hypothetical protein